MPGRFLRAAHQGLQVGKQLVHHAQLQARRQADRRAPGPQQQLLELPPDPLRRKVVQRDGPAQRPRGLVDAQLEAGRELHRPEHAQRIFNERRRIHRAKAPGLQVLEAPVWIQHLARQRVAKHRIEGEVSASGRFLHAHRRVARHGEALVTPPGL